MVNRLYEEASEFDWITGHEINMLEFDGYNEYWIDFSGLSEDERLDVVDYVVRNVSVVQGIHGTSTIWDLKEHPMVWKGAVVHCGHDESDYLPEDGYICAMSDSFDDDENTEHSTYIHGRDILKHIIKESENEFECIMDLDPTKKPVLSELQPGDEISFYDDDISPDWIDGVITTDFINDGIILSVADEYDCWACWTEEEKLLIKPPTNTCWWIGPFDTIDWPTDDKRFSKGVPRIKESEERKSSNIKDIIKDITSDMKLAGKFVSTFGTGITAFYEPIAKLLSGSGLHLDKYNIVLMIITGVAFMVQDADFDKLRDSLREKGLLKHLSTVTDFIKGSQNLVNGVLKNVSNATYGLADIMAFTFILAPTMNILTELIGEYGISGNSIGQLFTGLAAGIATYGIKSVIGKLRKKL